tara:strand:- start:2197 stop:3114 length:918 start_codon:yes stop_codon:yes gene_type:complete
MPLIFAQSTLPQSADFLAQQSLATEFLTALNGEIADYEIRNFPDGETYLRVLSDCLNRDIIILANLHQPNCKLLPLIFLCEVLKEMGCNKISLIAPYLPYMRQDIQFHPGEAVTSRFFAKLISQHIDHLITIDPHLHRYHSLSQIYTCETFVLQANPVIADWIKLNVDKPFIVGPDSESEQWAANVANMVGCPYLILEKQRFGDTNVKINAKSAKDYKGLTPVLIDDIISTGRTMIETAKWLSEEDLCPPICIGVHALFSGDALQAMQEANIKNVLTCSTITHSTNKIDISDLLITTYKQAQVSN